KQKSLELHSAAQIAPAERGGELIGLSRGEQCLRQCLQAFRTHPALAAALFDSGEVHMRGDVALAWTLEDLLASGVAVVSHQSPRREPDRLLACVSIVDVKDVTKV